MANLDQFRVACLATDGVEESELTDPVKALREQGAKVDVISPHPGKIQAFRHHDKSSLIEVNRTLDEIQPGEYDALLLPGGALNADALRMETKARLFAQAIQNEGKPIAVICHGSWLLASSGLVRGRRMTSYYTIQDDIKNAGAEWQDAEVVVDRNWVSSRFPKDIPAFNREMLRVFQEAKQGVRKVAAA